MPNWCHNRYAVQGKMGALIQFKNWIEGLYPTPRYHLALEHSKKFFILGVTGYLQATRFPTMLSQFNDLLPKQLGPSTMANEAYTDWLELLGTPHFDLSEENSRRISNLFYAAGGHFITWDDLDEEQQLMTEAIMATQSYDWYHLPFRSTKGFDELFNEQPDIPEMGLPGDFYSVMPPLLQPLLNGFNGHLTGRGRLSFNDQNAYNMNAFRYGTKWPSFHDGELEIHNETQASLDVQTAWSPPSETFDIALVEKFGLDFLNHRYIEEGCGFAGYIDIAAEEGVVESTDDMLVMDWTEEDKKKYGENEEALWENCSQIVVSPDYVKDIYDSTKKLSGLIGIMASKELEKKE